MSGEISLAAMFLVQNVLKSQHRPEECRADSQLDSLGLGGKMMSVAVRAGALLRSVRRRTQLPTFNAACVGRGWGCRETSSASSPVNTSDHSA